jgi:hypothetical protein
VSSVFGLTRPPVEPSGKSRAPDVKAPINFAFRLRQLLGVAARAEAVRYLLTANIGSATVAQAAKSSGYSTRSVQEALTSLAAAGAATLASDGSEQRFAIDRSRWAHLLDLEPHELPPTYHDWHYLRASQAADLLGHRVSGAFARGRVLMPARLGGERTWTRPREDHRVRPVVARSGFGHERASRRVRHRPGHVRRSLVAADHGGRADRRDVGRDLRLERRGLGSRRAGTARAARAVRVLPDAWAH